MAAENDQNTPPKSDYSAADITVLTGIEAVRKRPGMYFGSTKSMGQKGLFCEVLDNAIDEHLAGHVQTLRIDFHPIDGSWTISDDGKGIPLETSPRMLEAVFVELHAGSTFDGHTPHVHTGRLGTGLAPANAVSELLVVTVNRPSGRYEAIFRRGVLQAPLQRVGDCTQSGTTIRMRPDMEIFEEAPDLNEIEAHLTRVAHLNPGLRIEFCGRNLSQPGGLLTLAREHAVGPIADTLRVTGRAKEIDVDIAIVRDNRTSLTLAYSNHHEIESGVVHETIEQLLSYGPPAIVVATLMIQAPHYAGRTKDRLEMPEAGEAIREVLLPALR